MRRTLRRPVPIALILTVLFMLSTAAFVVNQASRSEALSDADSTGTLAGSSEPESRGIAQVPDNRGSANIPKPNERGAPTPFPTVVLPPMTAIPTNAVPDVWKNCPAFAGRADYPTPAPGESTTCPTPGPHREPPTPNPNDPFIIQACAAPDPPDDPDITKRQAESSSTVVIGTVQQVLPPRWTTPDGRRPANPHAQKDVENMAHIVTPVQLEVEQYLKGQQRQSRLLLWAFGGTIGQDVTDACGSTQFTFQPGQHVVVFLKERGQSQGNDPIFNVITRYVVGADEQATADDRVVPLQQVIDEIRAASTP